VEECQQSTCISGQREVAQMTLMVFAAIPIIGSKPQATLEANMKIVWSL